MRIALWIAIVAQFGLILISLVLAATSPPAAKFGDSLAGRLAFGGVTLTFTTVGAILLRRRPAQRVGWLLSVAALGWAVSNAAGAYARYASGAGQKALPGVDWALWLSGDSWTILASQGVLLLVLLLFPTGSLISPRWRFAAWLVSGWTVVSAFAVGLASGVPGVGTVTSATSPHPFGAWVLVWADWMPYGSVVLFALGAIALAMRFRRSRGVERQQLKWIVAAAAVAVVALATAFGALSLLGAQPTFSGAPAATGWLLTVAVVGTLSPGLVPVAIGVAILRYRLYDIDRLINRTLVYGALTATLAGAYVGAIALFQVALGSVTNQSPLAVAASTLLVAALFQPLRTGIQRAVDRRFYRRKYDAQRTVDAFRSRLRDEVDLSRLTDELGALVTDSLQPASVTIWLRSEGRPS